MEKKDLYLSDKQYQNVVGYIPIPEHDLRKVAKASADYAVKQIFKELKRYEDMGLMVDDKDKPVPAVFIDPIAWDGLKKLIEG